MEKLLLQAAQNAAQLLVLTAIFVPLERLFTLRREKLLREEWLNDLGYYFLNGLILGSLMALPVALLAAIAQQLVPAAVLDFAGNAPLWARVPVALFAGDIGSYWGHRWTHRYRLLWRLHLIHHSPTHVDWLVNTRAHPLDLVFTRMCGLVPLFALGLAQTTVMPVVVTLVGLVWTHLIHANVRWRFGWLEQILATPAFHHWHHTNDDKRDHNFAAIFPAIDRLFGTFHLPDSFPTVYGTDERPAPALWAQLVDPLLPAAKKTQQN